MIAFRSVWKLGSRVVRALMDDVPPDLSDRLRKRVESVPVNAKIYSRKTPNIFPTTISTHIYCHSIQPSPDSRVTTTTRSSLPFAIHPKTKILRILSQRPGLEVHLGTLEACTRPMSVMDAQPSSRVYFGVSRTACAEPLVLVAVQRISPESLIPTASVMVKPELEGISALRSTSTPLRRMKPTCLPGLNGW